MHCRKFEGANGLRNTFDVINNKFQTLKKKKKCIAKYLHRTPTLWRVRERTKQRVFIKFGGVT